MCRLLQYASVFAALVALLLAATGYGVARTRNQFTVRSLAPTSMSTPGLVHLRCNGGHVWMNAEMMVVSHPYYAVTDESGRFEFTDVPPGNYQIVAWHEGWRVVGQSPLYDVMTQRKVKRPVFSDPVIWSKHVTVRANGTAEIQFTLGEKSPQMPAGH